MLTQLPPQFVVPPVQLRVQTPLLQTLPPLQAMPQPPQLLLSVWVLTHVPEHSERPVPQLGAQVPLTQLVEPPDGG